MGICESTENTPYKTGTNPVNQNDKQKQITENLQIDLHQINHDEDIFIGVDLFEDAIRDFNLSNNEYKKLPNTYEFYKLKRVNKPKEGITYLDYLEWINYQKSIPLSDSVLDLFNKQLYLYKFVIKDMLEVGTYNILDGFYTYNKIDIEDYIDEEEKILEVTSLLNKHLFNLAYVNPAIGRGIFILNNNGKYLEIKGVDPLLDSTKIIGSNITRRRTLIGEDNTPYALELIEKDSNLSIRFRGTCFLDELQREKKWSKELPKLGIIGNMNSYKTIILLKIIDGNGPILYVKYEHNISLEITGKTVTLIKIKINSLSDKIIPFISVIIFNTHIIIVNNIIGSLLFIDLLIIIYLIISSHTITTKLNKTILVI